MALSLSGEDPGGPQRGAKGSRETPRQRCPKILWDPQAPGPLSSLQPCSPHELDPKVRASGRRCASSRRAGPLSDVPRVEPGRNRSSQPGGSSAWEGTQNTPHKLYGCA
jgi:hypothetical protein